MEQIRIVKEMREHDRRDNKRTGEFVRPRFMVWENVPGSLSSPGKRNGEDHRGEDFQTVLTEIVKIVCPNAPDVPLPSDRKWSKSGCLMGEGEDGCPFSIAWRIHDAQFWGVPQRRKRIALVADFGGQSAPEILFERKGMHGNFEESSEAREGTSSDVKGGDAATITSTYGTKWNGNAGAYNGENFVFERAISFQERAGKPGGGKGILIQDERIGALSTLNNQSVCCLNDQGGSQMGVTEDVTGTLRAEEHGHQPLVFEPGAASRVGGHVYEDDVAGTVRANAGDNQQAVCYGISSYESNAMKSANPHSGVYEAETLRTLDLNGGNPACNQGGMAVVQASGVVSKGNGDCFVTPEKHMSLSVGGGQAGQGYPCVCIEGNGSRPSHKGDGYAESETMYTLNGTEHHAVAYRKTSHAKSAEDGQGWAETQVNDTLNAFDSGETRTPTVVVDNKKTVYDWHRCDTRMTELGDTCNTMSASWGAGGNNMPYVLESKASNDNQQMEEPYNATTGSFMRAGNSGVAETLAARDYKDPQRVCNSVVRRLTPLECERLQGFPDGWTAVGEWTDSKGKKRKCSDSARYKALGNSIAIPFWFFLLRRISAQYERPATLGSLFDGIGGFPLCWERCNGPGTALWASEIEGFPIAVTKKHFPEGEE